MTKALAVMLRQGLGLTFVLSPVGLRDTGRYVLVANKYLKTMRGR